MMQRMLGIARDCSVAGRVGELRPGTVPEPKHDDEQHQQHDDDQHSHYHDLSNMFAI